MVLLSVSVALPMTFIATPLVVLFFGAPYAESGVVLAIHIWASVFVFLGVASSKWFLAEKQTSGTLNYYVFNEPALNGFSGDLSNERNNASNAYFLKEVIQVEVSPLKEILGEHLCNRKIDFLSVDVEGLDLDVLKSNDWSKFRPRFVLAEVLRSSLHALENDPVAQFMKGAGYVLFAKQVNTAFFRDETADCC
jgi:hypothetical protein